jgi:site-specific recombinase XerD
MDTRIHPPAAWLRELDDYYAWLRSAHTSPGTIKLHSYHLRRFATLHPHPYAVKRDDLIDYLGSGDWSAGYQRSIRTTLKAFYGWAREEKRIRKNPTKKLHKIAVPPGVPRPASEEDVAAGLEIADERVRLMIRLAAQAGLRCCEIAVVHTDDLIRDLVGWSLAAHGKGDKTRIVPLNPGLAADLLGMPEGYVFVGQIDGHLSAAYVSKLISRALPEGVTAHPMRHRFASVAYEGTGGDIRAVQELLGHASVATTQIYTKVPDGAKRRGVLAAA